MDGTATKAVAEQEICRDTLIEKYAKGKEATVEQVRARVARALASVEVEGEREKWQARFHANLRAGAIGAGRIMSAAGTALEATLINCFVQPVGDCIQAPTPRVTPASTKRCGKRRRPCAAAAASATIFPGSGRAAPK